MIFPGRIPGPALDLVAAGAGDAAPAAEDGSDADLHADAVFEGGYVGDNADQLIVLAEACKGFEGRVEGVFVESAEPFVEEEGVDPAFGARPIKRFIRREHSQKIARMIPAGKLKPKLTMHVDTADGNMQFTSA